MKNRIVALLTCTALCFSLVSCGSSEKPNESQSSPATSVGGKSVATDEELGGVDVDQGLFNVEITIPADFIEEGITQESLNEEASEAGFKSAALNEDGSVTCIMTKAQHQEMMDGIRDSIDQSLSKMVDPETYPTFVSVTANDDYTKFTVETSATELGLTESFSVMAFYVFAGMYHAFNGTQVDDVTVSFVNADTGEVIEEAHSSDAG